jgi:NAD(P)-dependent dehydrogenase (short-subunit alcohol dehydrogenase family)
MTTAIAGARSIARPRARCSIAPVRVNAVCPGIVLTEHVKAQMPPGRLQAYTAALPIARSAEPAEAAAAYVYLMQSTYATGQILPVDGGGLLV